MKHERAGDKPLNSIDPGSLKHVEANRSVVVHNDRMVGLNEAHTPHISSKVKHMINPVYDFQTVIHHPKINEMKLITEHVLGHVLIFLPIRSNNLMSLIL